MSRLLLSRSPDLQRLQDEGYDFDIRNNQLVLKVVYATTQRSVESGLLVSELTLAGVHTSQPGNHGVHFIPVAAGDVPCGELGSPLEWLIHQRSPVDLGAGLIA